MNFAVVAAGDLARFRSWGRERGWRNLRLLSSAPSSLKTDLGFDVEGAQLPGVSVFGRGEERPLHFYSGCAMMGGSHFRGMDLLSPVWNFLDLTPEGRGDFMPRSAY